MGRRPWAGDRPVCGGPGGGHQGPGLAHLRLRRHRRGDQPEEQLGAHAPLLGPGVALLPEQQRVAGRVGAPGGTPRAVVVQGQRHLDGLRRLPGAHRQRAVLLLLDQAQGPPAPQHRRPRTGRKPHGRLLLRGMEHQPPRGGREHQGRILRQRPRPGGAPLGHRLRQFAPRRRPALPHGQPPQRGEPHRQELGRRHGGGRLGLSGQPAARALRARLPRLHAHPARNAGAELHQADLLRQPKGHAAARKPRAAGGRKRGVSAQPQGRMGIHPARL